LDKFSGVSSFVLEIRFASIGNHPDDHRGVACKNSLLIVLLSLMFSSIIAKLCGRKIFRAPFFFLSWRHFKILFIMFLLRKNLGLI
jgi:hypothetical protein